MLRKFQQWRTTIQPISTKLTASSYHKSLKRYLVLNIQTKPWDRYNSMTGLNRLIGSQTLSQMSLLWVFVITEHNSLLNDDNNLTQ